MMGVVGDSKARYVADDSPALAVVDKKTGETKRAFHPGFGTKVPNHVVSTVYSRSIAQDDAWVHVASKNNVLPSSLLVCRANKATLETEVVFHGKTDAWARSIAVTSTEVLFFSDRRRTARSARRGRSTRSRRPAARRGS